MFRHESVLVCLSIILLVLVACGTGASSPTISPAGIPGETPSIPPSLQTAPEDVSTSGGSDKGEVKVSAETPSISPSPQTAPEDVPAGGGGQEEETKVPVETFSILSSHQTAPEDVLQEVWFFFGGAGEDELECQDSYQYPTIAYPPDWLQDKSLRLLLDLVSVGTCGWQPDESVRITIEFPDGKSMHEDVHAMKNGEGYGVAFDYATDWNDPPGIYTVLFEGKSGMVHYSQRVARPSVPGLVWYWHFDREWRDSGELFLYNFGSNERIRLFAYEKPDEWEPKGVLVAWQEFQVDFNGHLTVQSELNDPFNIIGYAAVGETSGEATTYWRYFDTEEYFGTCEFFWEAILPGYVVADTGVNRLAVREGPGLNYPVVEEVVSGIWMKVIRQRLVNDDGEAWWYVRLSDGIDGWVIDDKVTFIGETPSTPPSPQTVPEDVPAGDDDEEEGMSVPVETFSISPYHQTTPEDLLQEVMFFGAGGWGGPECYASLQHPTVIWPLDYQQDRPLELVWGVVSAYTCGWQPNELVHVTMEFPDGRSISQDVRATMQLEGLWEGYGVAFDYVTGLNDPPGLYTVVFEGNSGVVEYSRHVIEPSGPRLLWDWDENLNDNGELFLYNFEPNEFIRLCAYKRHDKWSSDGVLVAWQEFQVDSNGQLVVRSQPSNSLNIGGYAAVGNISGEATGHQYWSSVDAYVPVFFDSILSYYVIANTGSDRLNVRSGPGLDHRIVTKVVSGTQMRVTGPSRADDSYEEWLPVHLDDGTEGWVAKAWVKRLAQEMTMSTPTPSEPTGSSNKLEFIAYGEVACGGIAPIPGCVYILQEWVGAEGPVAPGKPIKVLIMDPRSVDAPDIDSCQGYQVDDVAYTWSEDPICIRARGEPCDLSPEYLFCVCDPGDFVRLEPRH